MGKRRDWMAGGGWDGDDCGRIYPKAHGNNNNNSEDAMKHDHIPSASVRKDIDPFVAFIWDDPAWLQERSFDFPTAT